MDIDNEDLRYGYFDLLASRAAYERAAAMYDGSVEEIYSSPKVTKLLARFGLDSIESMNFAHIPVDAVANKLRLNAVVVEDQDQESGDVPTAPRRAVSNGSDGASGNNKVAAQPGETAAKKPNPVNAVIEDLFDYNEFSEELPILFRNVGKFGDGYMMVWPVVGEEADDPSISKGYNPDDMAKTLSSGDTVVEDNHIEVPEGKKSIVAVDMMLLDPFTTRVYYDIENPKKKKFAIRSWVEGEEQRKFIRVNLYYADRIERWKHHGKPSKRKNSAQKWEPFTDDGKPAVLPNPFDEVPIFHFRTDRTYGKPDHYNAYGPQLAINKLVTSHMATIDYQSFPQRYALLDPTADQSGFQGADSDPFAPEDGAGVYPEDDDNDSQLEADPGVLWQLSGMKEVGQFDAATADSYLKPFDRYVKALAQVTDTPFHYFDRQGERPPSGENIRQVNEQLNAKAAARQTSYGSEIRKSVTFALNMLGHDVERVTVIWEPLENVTSLVEWQAILAKQSAGVPNKVTLIEAGYREDLVDEWIAEAEAKAAQEAADAQAAKEQEIKLAGEAKAQTAIANQNAKANTPGATGPTPAAKPTTPAAKPTDKPKPSAPKK